MNAATGIVEHAGTPADRLTVTMVGAIIVHALIVLGVTFNAPDTRTPNNEALALDVILVYKASPDIPEDPDFLAQANQQGGGTMEEKVRPKNPISGPIPKDVPGEAPMPVTPQAPRPVEQTPTQLLSARDPDATLANPTQAEEAPPKPLPNAAQLFQHSAEMARLEAELAAEKEAYAKRPRRKFITANTREYEFAAYMQAWVQKVERIGTLNFPQQARQQNLSGSLVLSVAINADGTVESIKVLNPSEYPVLDKAAIHIVELAGPYAPFPANISESVDILHITRTWRFLQGTRFGSD